MQSCVIFHGNHVPNSIYFHHLNRLIRFIGDQCQSPYHPSRSFVIDRRNAFMDKLSIFVYLSSFFSYHIHPSRKSALVILQCFFPDFIVEWIRMSYHGFFEQFPFLFSFSLVETFFSPENLEIFFFYIWFHLDLWTDRLTNMHAHFLFHNCHHDCSLF